MECAGCQRALAADELAYITLGRLSGTLPWCGHCITTSRLLRQLHWDRPVWCDGCGQPVCYQKRSRPSLYACCGRLACLNTVNVTAELARRHPPRACAGCGVVFIPARKDNRHCLPACRSRAYRQRQLMITPSTLPELYSSGPDGSGAGSHRT